MTPGIAMLFTLLLMTRFFSVISLLASVWFGLEDADRASNKRIGTIFGASFSVAFACCMLAVIVARLETYPLLFVSGAAIVGIVAVRNFETQPLFHKGE